MKWHLHSKIVLKIFLLVHNVWSGLDIRINMSHFT